MGFAGKRSESTFRWELSAKILLTAFAAACHPVYSAAPLGLIGGQNTGESPYGAFVSEEETLVPIPFLFSSGNIESVSINKSGMGIIGGFEDAKSFASFVSTSQEFTPLIFPPTDGGINSVSINDHSMGLIGGFDTEGGYVAHVFPDGTVTPLSLVLTRRIFATSLNDEGVGLIGGEGAIDDTNSPYVAYVSSIGEVSPMTIETEATACDISTVSINSSGNGLIGGHLNFISYAAFVSPDGPSISTLLATPVDFGTGINSVSLNDAGQGLIGGSDGDFAYAGLVTYGNSVVSPLFDTPFEGSIYSVAINQSGIGLIGGTTIGNKYAAIRRADGTLQPLFTEISEGEIYSVAINDVGVGLIGGSQAGSLGYVAIVAPDGTVTPLTLSGVNVISQVALDGLSIAATPTTIGSYMGPIYSQLAFNSALESRFVSQNRSWGRTQPGATAQREMLDDEMHLAYHDLALSSRPKSMEKKKEEVQPILSNGIWVAPFGDYFRLSKSGSTPSFSNQVGGALLGYDYNQKSYMVGASIGYAFNYIAYSQGLGHTKVQEEVGNIYGGYYCDHFRLNGALWGGWYQFYNTRHSLASITSKGKTHGWIVAPHLEFASPWAIDQSQRYLVEPFVQFDWINSWQKRFTETGSSGLNLEMDSHYGSLLQSEVGLRFYEQFKYGWGAFNLEEKLSYINQSPFGFDSETTSFVGGASSFPIAVGSPRVENLGSIGLVGSFMPKNSSYPFGGFAVEVTANGTYQSYFGSLFCGKEF